MQMTLPEQYVVAHQLAGTIFDLGVLIAFLTIVSIVRAIVKRRKAVKPAVDT